MKTLRTIAAAALLSAFASQAQEAPDTLIVVNRPHSVTVTESPRGNSIVIIGQDDDNDFFYSYSTERNDSDLIAAAENGGWGLSLPFLKEKAHKRSKVLWFNQVYVGIAMPADGPRGLDGSVEAGVGQLVGFSWQRSSRSPIIALGLGIHYQQYTLHGGQIFGRDNRALTIVPLEEGQHDPSSRLRNFGFQIPLTVTQKISGDFGITIGAALKMNTYTKASSSFKTDDTNYSRDFKGLNQRGIGVDLYGAIGFTEEFGLYVRYTPTKLFKSGFGPDLSTISFGITIGM